MIHKAIFILICVDFFCCKGYSENIDFNVISDSVKCYGESTGKITINIISGNPEFNIKLYNNKPATKQKYLAKADIKSTSYSFNNLPADNYYITIEDSKGNYLQKDIKIDQPDKLKVEPITIEECFSSPNKDDAVIKANCTGGTKPYVYLWSENTGNQTSQLAKNITPGIYRCIINDKNNCGSVSATIFFNEKVHKECFSDFE